MRRQPIGPSAMFDLDGHVVRQRQGGFHGGGHGHQELVAYLMPMAVIDGLEAIQIQVDHGHPLVTPLSLGHALLQPIGE